MRDHDLTEGPIAGHFKTLAIPAAMGMLFSTSFLQYSLVRNSLS